MQRVETRRYIMKAIEKYIQSYFGIPTSDLSQVADLFHPQQLKKNDFWLKTGSYSSQLSFVKSGYLRIFATSKNGEKEITQWITTPDLFVADLSTLIFNTPSRWNIQALSDCELYTISQEDYHRIGDVIKRWHELEKMFIAKCFVTLENRVFSQLSLTAEEKYQEFFQVHPEIFNQVPLQYLASMLGMTPETLSRIRKKLSS